MKHRVVYRSDCAGAEKKDGCGCGGNADNMGKKKVKSILRKKKFVVAEYIPPVSYHLSNLSEKKDPMYEGTHITTFMCA